MAPVHVAIEQRILHSLLTIPMYDVQTTPHISSWGNQICTWGRMVDDTCPYTLYMVPSLSTQQGEIHVKKIREYTNYAVENITRDIYVC